MSTDLFDALERAIPRTDTGPALPSADERLARGRRGVRRRRTAGATLAVGAAAAAVLLPSVLGGAGPADRRPAQVAEGGSSSQDPSPTSSPTASPPPTSPAPEVSSPPVSSSPPGGDFERAPIELVRLDWDGRRPVTFPGRVTVVDELDDPFARSGVLAWAGTVRYDGLTYWALVHQAGNGSFGTDTRPIPGRTIEQWVRDHEEVDTSPLRPWVDLQPDGTLNPRTGVRIVEQRSPARVDQADPALPSATAMIEVDGARVCLVVRADPAVGDQIAMAESEFKGCQGLPGWDYPGNPSS